jgi:hypothetical protein
MKIKDLQKIIKESVREVIQEELKDILLEAIKTPKPSLAYESKMSMPNTDVAAPSHINPVMSQQPLPENEKMKLRENMMNVLDGMRPGANGTMSANTNSIPLQVHGAMDTTSPNGQLPNGEVSMDQIMGLMSGK